MQRKYPQSILGAKVEDDSSNQKYGTGNSADLSNGQPDFIRSDEESYGGGLLSNKMFRTDLENFLINWWHLTMNLLHV